MVGFMQFQFVLYITFDLYLVCFTFCIQYRNVVTIYTALIQLVIYDINFFIKLLHS